MLFDLTCAFWLFFYSQQTTDYSAS